MNKLAAIGLAGALTAATMGATTTTAEAGGGRVLLGVAIGLGVAALIHHHYYGTRTYSYAYAPHGVGLTAYAGPSSHASWCQWRFRSYSLATDTYLGFDGVRHRCVSPHG
jgi:hypothetical protein